MQQLSGQDAMFIHSELDGLPQHITGVNVYDQSTVPSGENVRFKDILSMLDNRVHLSPIFRRKLVEVPKNLGQPYWVEDADFDIEHHVRHIALPKPGDWRQLCILVSRLHSQPLRRDKPVWEIYVIEGLNNVAHLPPNCFAVLTKIHHAAMDGATGAQFTGCVHDLTPETKVFTPTDKWRPESASVPKMLTSAYLDAWKKPGEFYRFAREAVPAFSRLRKGLKNQDFQTLDSKQKTRFQGKLSRHRVVESLKFDFETVRAIKNTVPGATINDVMLCIIAGGLHTYLDSKGETPASTLVAGCPIDVRSPEEKASGGNMVGMMNVALCSNVAEPVDRLRAIQNASTEAKAYAQALGPRMMLDISDLLPGGVLSVALRAAAATGLTEATVVQNTFVTNVPGPAVQFYFCGALQVDSMSFGPLMPNVGLFHVVYSAVQNKTGTISISITACRDMLPDPAYYVDCLQQSFKQLNDAALSVGKRSSTKQTKGAK
ncbi:MAG: wax ester/triacylglycerol synthase family O-acyltransferase [Pseudomonadota bacterium]